MAILVENFRDFVLSDYENKPRVGEIDMGRGNVRGTMLAHGVLNFDSGVSGQRRFDSAGIHGDEVDGQYALNDVVNGVISGEVALPSGEWLVALGNVLAIRENVREVGYNLNRLFGVHGRNKAQGTYERGRADELDALEDSFKPRSHTDWHGTISPVAEPFLVSSIPVGELRNPEYRDYLMRFGANFGVQNTIIRPYSDRNRYTTFEWSATDRMARSGLVPQAETVELGQIGTALSASMVGKISSGLRRVLSNGLEIPGGLDFPSKFWRIDEQVLKLSDGFKFEVEGITDFMPLEEGQLVATDGKTEYRAKKDQVLVFPHDSVAVGEQTFLLISPESNDKS